MDNQMQKNSTFKAWGDPHISGNGYVGKYHAPGLDTGHVWEGDNKLAIFPTEELAELAAKDRLFTILNDARAVAASLHRHGKPERYRRLSGPEFAVLLSEVGITPTFFAEIYGTTVKRVLAWIDGVNEKGNEELVPHPAYLLLMRMKADPSLIDKIEEDTRAMTTKRRPLDGMEA